MEETTGANGHDVSVAANRGFNSLSSHSKNPQECPPTVTKPRLLTRTCDGCQDSFLPEGHETLCETCEINEVFRRSCSVCGMRFTTDDLGRWECSFCYDNNTD